MKKILKETAKETTKETAKEIEMESAQEGKKDIVKKTVKEKLPKGITKCKDGRYQARYTYEGKRYCFYGRNIKELENRLLDIRYEIAHGMYAKEERVTVNAWYQVWMNEYKSTTVKKGTIESYECMYNYYIKAELGKKLLKDVRGEHLQKLLNDLQRNGYSKSTISLIHVLLNSMFKQALKNELIKKNPVELITLPRGEKKKERRVLSREEQELLLKEVKGNELEPIIQIALATGMRIGELTGLEWNNIDFEKKEIRVEGTLKITRKGECFKDTPKTSTSNRTIPLLPKAEMVLKRLRVIQKEQRLSMGMGWKPLQGLEQLVFTREDGKPFTSQHIRQQLVHIVKAINVKYFTEEESAYVSTNNIKDNMPKQKLFGIEKFENFTPHTLRHTFATRALESGIPPKVVQEILGHSSITMTLDLYTHVLPKTKAEELRKLEGIM